MNDDWVNDTTLTTVPVLAPHFGQAELEAMERVLESGVFAGGPEVRAFETEFSHMLVRGWPTVAAFSGRSAMTLTLRALDIGPGDEVIVPSFAPVTPAEAIVAVGATPVFADIDPVSFTLSVDAVGAAITDRTRAVLVVHLFGHPAALDELSALAVHKGIHLIEDASHAPGALAAAREVGTWGTAAVFSLGPSMNIAAGSGAMIACADPELAQQVVKLRDEPQAPNSAFVDGQVSDMSEFTAAVGRAQLVSLLERTDRRRMHAALLRELVTRVKHPALRPGCDPAWRQFTIRVERDRSRVAEQLRREWGIGTSIDYTTPCHRQPAFAAYAPSGGLPETERAAAEALGLPVHPGLTVEDLQRVADAVNFLLG